MKQPSFDWVWCHYVRALVWCFVLNQPSFLLSCVVLLSLTGFAFAEPPSEPLLAPVMVAAQADDTAGETTQTDALIQSLREDFSELSNGPTVTKQQAAKAESQAVQPLRELPATNETNTSAIRPIQPNQPVMQPLPIVLPNDSLNNPDAGKVVIDLTEFSSAQPTVEVLTTSRPVSASQQPTSQIRANLPAIVGQPKIASTSAVTKADSPSLQVARQVPKPRFDIQQLTSKRPPRQLDNQANVLPIQLVEGPVRESAQEAPLAAVAVAPEKPAIQPVAQPVLNWFANYDVDWLQSPLPGVPPVKNPSNVGLSWLWAIPTGGILLLALGALVAWAIRQTVGRSELTQVEEAPTEATASLTTPSLGVIERSVGVADNQLSRIDFQENQPLRLINSQPYLVS